MCRTLYVLDFGNFSARLEIKSCKIHTFYSFSERIRDQFITEKEDISFFIVEAKFTSRCLEYIHPTVSLPIRNESSKD